MARPILLTVTLLWAPFAFAQATLGALLDAGAKPLSPAQFKEELVQRTIVGPAATGNSMEIVYVPDGSVQGVSSNPSYPKVPGATFNGEWQVDDKARICTSIRLNPAVTTFAGGLVLPARCQYWFKLGTQYYFADSDTDRSAKVLSRTIKQ